MPPVLIFTAEQGLWRLTQKLGTPAQINDTSMLGASCNQVMHFHVCAGVRSIKVARRQLCQLCHMS